MNSDLKNRLLPLPYGFEIAIWIIVSILLLFLAGPIPVIAILSFHIYKGFYEFIKRRNQPTKTNAGIE